jgi:thiamine kinase-like enzyme
MKSTESKSTDSKSSFKTIIKPKEEFHETNQLKKESKEMNSKAIAPRLQETKVFVTQKSESNQNGTQDNMESFKREVKEEVR